MKTLQSTIAILLLTLLSVSAADEGSGFRLARIFGDQMVLQQEKPITVWGWGKPGVDVSITLTRDAAIGKAAVAKTKAQSQSKKATETTDDSYSVTMRYDEQNAPAWPAQTVKAKAGDDGRWSATFTPVKASFQPVWIIAESERKTVTAADVLIGEIWVCAGQSNMKWRMFNRKGLLNPTSECPGLRYIAWDDSSNKPLKDIQVKATWSKCSPETADRFSAVPYLYGMLLHRHLKVPVGIINVARGGTTGDTWCLREELDSIDHVTMKETLREYDGQVAMWEKPEEVKRIMARWEQNVVNQKAEHTELTAKAKSEGAKAPRLRLPDEPVDPRNAHSPPAGLFNATVMPIRNFSLRGVLYYQGENNVFGRWTRYEHTFPKVPLSFRKAFGDPNLPFGCISMPGWGIYGSDPEMETVTGGYAIIRDIHHRALESDENAELITTYPTGNSYIHPAEKLPVAEYVARWALAEVYKKKLLYRANRFEKMTIHNDKVHVYFDLPELVQERMKKHKGKLSSWMVLPQTRQGKASIEGFIIAGKDRRWYPAKAKEKQVNGRWLLEVWSDLVTEPVAIRYGWANWPTGNLVGGERLPVQTFRTDDWPIIEGVSYSKETKDASEKKIRQLEEVAKRQAIDRKIRQMQIDLPALEAELNTGNYSAQLQTKLEGIVNALKSIEGDKSLSKKIRKDHPKVMEKISAISKELEAMKTSVQ